MSPTPNPDSHLDFFSRRLFMTRTHTTKTLFGLLLATMLMLVGMAPIARAAGPEISVSLSGAGIYKDEGEPFYRGNTAVLNEDTVGAYRLKVTNTGDEMAEGTFHFVEKFGPGVKVSPYPNPVVVSDEVGQFGSAIPCTGDGSAGNPLECDGNLYPGLEAGQSFTLITNVAIANDAPDEVTSTIDVTGAGTVGTKTATTVTQIEDLPPFEVKTFDGKTIEDDESESTVAGGHPYESFNFFNFNYAASLAGESWRVPIEDLKTADATLPLGLFGNPAAAPRCPLKDISQIEFLDKCPPGSKVGRAKIGLFNSPYESEVGGYPIYNVVPDKGHPAQFLFRVVNSLVTLYVTMHPRTEKYSISIGAADSPRLFIKFVKINFWGVPSDHGSGSTGAPFLTNPVACSDTEPEWKLALDTWESSGTRLSDGLPNLADPNWYQETDQPAPVTGCDESALTSLFNPSLDVKPVQGGGATQADQPTGLSTKFTFPQTNDPTDPGTVFDTSLPQSPEPKDVTVKLPAGLTISPSSADGLQACSDRAGDPAGDQIHYDTTNPVDCPDASKIGTVTATTPLLASHDPVTDAVTGADPIPGNVYLIKPHPGDLSSSGDRDGTFRLLMELNYPRYGINFKLPGTAVADKNTGQLTATFTENPQLPAKSLEVNLKSGPRAPLASPITCGSYKTDSTVVPWSTPGTPDAHPSSMFNVGSGPNGSACANSPGARPFNPGISGGVEKAVAGANSPFLLKLTRNDGDQELSSVDVTLPKGLTAKLAGVPYCSEAAIAAADSRPGSDEQANPSCPAASQIGSFTAGAGPGSNPYYVPGKTYLAGPYKGAPLSFVFVTPAVAGPFDLGTVVVRAAAFVDSETAQVTVKTDPIPQMLDGVPLRIRSIATRIDRANFTLNPTSCRPKTISASLGGASGASASPSTSFQVGDCKNLKFTPKLGLKLKGGTKRGDFPALTATLSQPAGQANIAKTVVTLPHSEFLEQGHIRTICTRVQFAADQCPAGSVYGTAVATTPLLDKPLEGPVYLRSSSHALPDLVAALHGQVDVDLVGRIDSVNGGIRTTFESVPDAPVSSFTLKMQGGKKGLLVNSRNICSTRGKANVEMEAQNGRRADSNPVLRNGCKKSKKKGKKSKRS